VRVVSARSAVGRDGLTLSALHARAQDLVTYRNERYGCSCPATAMPEGSLARCPCRCPCRGHEPARLFSSSRAIPALYSFIHPSAGLGRALRVTFTCGGRLINSWAKLYPAIERRRYDPILER